MKICEETGAKKEGVSVPQSLLLLVVLSPLPRWNSRDIVLDVLQVWMSRFRILVSRERLLKTKTQRRWR